MEYSSSKKRLFTRQFWKTIETRYYALFLIAVFFTFSSIGYVSDLLNNLQFTYSQLVVSVLITGTLSAGYAYAATKRPPFIVFFLALQLLYIFVFRPQDFAVLKPEELDLKFTIVATGILFSITAGYAFFVIFITKVGINHFLLKAEMNLAKEIHDVLVPEIKLKSKGFDIYGKSIPTSEVGGDLIDVVENNNGLFCSVADVSGHGVPSGVYTGMFKSSLRTILSSKNKLDTILFDVNESLVPLTKKNMFITSSIIKFLENDEAEFTVAGHLPILHFRKTDEKVEELLIKQIPIGVKAGFNFTSQSIQFCKGDIFALITDGITETNNKNKVDFGIERVKEIIQSSSEKSAEEISNLIFDEVSIHGNQKDDITLLIIKCY